MRCKQFTYICTNRNKQSTGVMTSKEILSTRNEKGIIFLSNDAANWDAVSRDGVHMITFYDTDENMFYKTQESFAKRVSQLIRCGR